MKAIFGIGNRNDTTGSQNQRMMPETRMAAPMVTPRTMASARLIKVR